MKVKLTVPKEFKKDSFVYGKLTDGKAYFQAGQIFEGLSVLPYGVEIIVNDGIKVFYDKSEYGFSGTRGIYWVYLFGEKKIGYYCEGYSQIPSEDIVKLFDNIAKVEIKFIGSQYHRDPMFT